MFRRQQGAVAECRQFCGNGTVLAGIALAVQQLGDELRQPDAFQATDHLGGRVALDSGGVDQHLGDADGGDRLDEPILDRHFVMLDGHRGRAAGELSELSGLHDG